MNLNFRIVNTKVRSTMFLKLVLILYLYKCFYRYHLAIRGFRNVTLADCQPDEKKTECRSDPYL